jgi:ABC-type transport system involved in multi-copper enzyme maturation permease subunit
MKAVIIKELRENAKWALLLCLAVAGALAWGLNTNDAETSSLVGSTMSMITAIAFPVVGLTLGLLQVLQDSSPGRWGFLTHRPISRSRIVIAKCLAGAGFYLLATGIPLTAAVYWAATPGRLAVPFDWHMILPRLADLLGGSMLYAAAL